MSGWWCCDCREKKHAADQRIAELQALIALANGAPDASNVYGHGFIDPFDVYVSTLIYLYQICVVFLPKRKLQTFLFCCKKYVRCFARRKICNVISGFCLYTWWTQLASGKNRGSSVKGVDLIFPLFFTKQSTPLPKLSPGEGKKPKKGVEWETWVRKWRRTWAQKIVEIWPQSEGKLRPISSPDLGG